MNLPPPFQSAKGLKPNAQGSLDLIDAGGKTLARVPMPTAFELSPGTGDVLFGGDGGGFDSDGYGYCYDDGQGYGYSMGGGHGYGYGQGCYGLSFGDGTGSKL